MTSKSTLSRTLDSNQAVLMVIDVQEKFAPVIHQWDQVLTKTAQMIEGAKLLDIPILVTEQYPKGLGSTANILRTCLPESAMVLEKSTFDCLSNHGIESSLAFLGRKQVIICGVETHVCVNQTTHHLLAKGYQVHLIEEAISSRMPENKAVGLAKMLQSGAIPSSVEMALFELMHDSAHPKFKQALAIIK